MTKLSPIKLQRPTPDGLDRSGFIRLVATFDSQTARQRLLHLYSQPCWIDPLSIDIVLDRLIELDGVEATDAWIARFIDTLEQ